VLLKKTKIGSEDGFSLVTVLAVMAVVMICIVFISQTKVRQQRVQKALKVKQSYADVNQALIHNIVDIFHKEMATTCLDPAAVLTTQDLDGTADFRFTKSITGASGNGIVLPAPHQAAISRCAVPAKPASGSSTSADKNRFYFCIQLNQGMTAAINKAPRDSILGASYAFAEFAVELIDLQTQAPLNCNEYSTRKSDFVAGPPRIQRDGSAGMAVTMALYWANKTGQTYTYSQKALSYIANQN